MTIRIETANAVKSVSWGRRLWMRISDAAQAMDDGPHEYADARIKSLTDEVIRLSARLDALEGRTQRAA